MKKKETLGGFLKSEGSQFDQKPGESKAHQEEGPGVVFIWGLHASLGAPVVGGS